MTATTSLSSMMSKVKTSWQKRKQKQSREAVANKPAQEAQMKTAAAEKTQNEKIPQLPSLYFGRRHSAGFGWTYDKNGCIVWETAMKPDDSGRDNNAMDEEQKTR